MTHQHKTVSFIFFSFISILCIGATLVSSSTPTAQVIQIAIVIPIDESHTPRGPYSEQIFDQYAATFSPLFPLAYQAMKDFKQRITSLGGIPLHDGLGTTVGMNYTFINVPFTDTTTLINMAHMIANGTYGSFQVVYPVYSLDYTQFALGCDTYQSCVVVSNWPPQPQDYICQIQNPPLPATLPSDCIARGRREGLRRFDSLLGVLSDFSSAALVQVIQAQQLQEKKLAFIYSADPTDVYLYQSAINFATDLGMHQVYSYVVSETELNTGPWSPQQAAAVVNDLIKANPDGLFFFSEATDTTVMDHNFIALIQAMQAVGYNPPAFHAVNNAVTTSDPSLTQFMYYSIQWSENLRGVDYRAYNTSTNMELWPAEPGQDSPQVYAAAIATWNPPIPPSLYLLEVVFSYLGVVVQKLVEASGSIDPLSMLAASHSISEPTIMGLLQFDGMGRRVIINNDIALVQFIGPTAATQTMRLVQPISVAQPAVFPTPKWSERAYVAGSYNGVARFGSAAEQVIVAMSALSIFIVIVCAVLTILLRNSTVMKASASVFLLYFCAGAVTLLLANFFQVPAQSDSFCQAQVWLLSVGFNCMFAPLFIKTLRIYLIFNQNRLQVLKLSNTKLTVILLCILGFDIVLNTIWTVTGNMVTQNITVDIYRPASNYESCVSSSAGQAFAYVSLAGKAILILSGLAITWMSRTVSEVFNEAVYLGASIYATTLVSSLFLPIVTSSLIDSRSSQYVIRSLGIIVITLSNICMIFIPKFALIFFGFDKDVALVNAKNTSLQVAGASGKKQHGSGALREIQKQSKYLKSDLGQDSNGSSAGVSNTGIGNLNPRFSKLDPQITQLQLDIAKQTEQLEKLLDSREKLLMTGSQGLKGSGVEATATGNSTHSGQNVKDIEAPPPNPNPMNRRQSNKSLTSGNTSERASRAIPANQIQGNPNGNVAGNGRLPRGKSREGSSHSILEAGNDHQSLLPNVVQQEL